MQPRLASPGPPAPAPPPVPASRWQAGSSSVTRPELVAGPSMRKAAVQQPLAPAAAAVKAAAALWQLRVMRVVRVVRVMGAAPVLQASEVVGAAQVVQALRAARAVQALKAAQPVPPDQAAQSAGCATQAPARASLAKESPGWARRSHPPQNSSSKAGHGPRAKTAAQKQWACAQRQCAPPPGH